MLDPRKIREDPEGVRQRLVSKGSGDLLDPAIEINTRRLTIIKEVEVLKNERNMASKELGQKKKEGEDIGLELSALRELSDRIKGLDGEQRELDTALREQLLALPNLPHPTVPVGTDETGNVLVREVGSRREFSFAPKPHWELGAALDILDFERAARMSGSGFPMLVGMGASLQRALITFMLDVHVREHGYREVLPPFLCNSDAMTGTGQLPKMAEDMYRVADEDLYLVPTAEVPVTNIHREEIIEAPLPLYYTAYTPCWRREAGAAGRDTRGMIRVHQFDKVEMVKFVEPEGSYQELETLLTHATDILDQLELPYRIIELCSGDLSFAAAKCFDIELWAPAQERWLEVSSCSNFEDFQARRANIRYRNAEGKPTFVHTLNGSGVALPRLMVRLLETFQQEDGSVQLPQAIRPYLGGVDAIRAESSRSR